MAIHAYVGKPGHGKSYGVVEHVVIPSLKQNRHVYTNIPLCADKLLALFGGNITQLPSNWFEIEDLGDILPPGAVAVIDECWRRWPSGQNVNQAKLADKSLLAEHRHRVDTKNNSMRIVLVTQDLAQISSWVRLLVETTFRIRKYNKKSYKVDVYQGSVTGDAPPRSKLVSSQPGRFNKEIFTYYQSATLSQSGMVGDESSADSRASILRSPALWACMAAVFILFPLGVAGVYRFFASSPSSIGSHSNKEVPAHSVPPEPPLSTSWRLVGFVHPSRPDPNSKAISEALALISDTNGNTRYISFSHCRYVADFTEAYCMVDGMKITGWALKKTIPIVGGLIGGGG
ncbi:zonular occludens toxin domain-containing protein [Pseudomonas sp. UM16]|uniref:zonular occludens toxin domain-containing protein n=1 Tax=Pseudomonas sp. UM16 TaxID=3158962 RepID=UPI00398FED67